MNWQECTWIEAANAFAAGTHEYETKWVESDCTSGWHAGDDTFNADPHAFYRIREKSRTITVTIPRPLTVSVANSSSYITAMYSTGGEMNTAYDAIRAAMSEQP